MESFGHKIFISSQPVHLTLTGVLYPRVRDFNLYTWILLSLAIASPMIDTPAPVSKRKVSHLESLKSVQLETSPWQWLSPCLALFTFEANFVWSKGFFYLQVQAAVDVLHSPLGCPGCGGDLHVCDALESGGPAVVIIWALLVALYLTIPWLS